MNIDKRINKIGEELVKCNYGCKGIINDPKKGIIPRCLILEEGNGKENCIVVGLNPGGSNEKERKYYLENGISYSSVKDYFKEKNWAYFKWTREVLKSLGFDGDILWTDLAKCEAIKRGEVPNQTLRVCINKFLIREVEAFKSSTIFALGNEAFNYCSLSFPEHFVVGIPHPTGSHNSGFNKFKKDLEKNPASFKKEISKRKDAQSNYRAIKLSKISQN